MAIPYSHDLSSCIDREVGKIRIYIKNCMKSLPKVKYLELPLKQEHFTSHGMQHEPLWEANYVEKYN